MKIPGIGGFELPRGQVDPGRVQTLRLSLAQLREMSDDELLKLLTGESELKGLLRAATAQSIQAVLHERALQRATKPRWTEVPSFWLLVVAVLLAALGAPGAVKSWFQPAAPAAPAPAPAASAPDAAAPSSSPVSTSPSSPAP